MAPFGVVPRPPAGRDLSAPPERRRRSGCCGRRQHRLVQRLERRFPRLYDARHAAAGIGRALGPLIWPLVAALLIALLTAVVAWLGIEAPSIDLPSVDLPDVSLSDSPFPELGVPLTKLSRGAMWVLPACSTIRAAGRSSQPQSGGSSTRRVTRL